MQTPWSHCYRAGARNGRSALLLAVIAASLCASCRPAERSNNVATPVAAYGAIQGRVRLSGMPPENAAIRMSADPMCNKAAGGTRVLQQTVVTGADGGVANVFVQLQGSFPDAPARTDPIVVDQIGCVYVPRVVGVQVGQPLEIRNSDPGLHNIHAISSGKDGFNVGQATAGLVNTFKLTTEGMTKLQCDVHNWMLAFVGVVRHPYFAVTNTDGMFELRNVPIGVQTVQIWHERYGLLQSNVRVDADSASNVEFTYSEPADSLGKAP